MKKLLLLLIVSIIGIVGILAFRLDRIRPYSSPSENVLSAQDLQENSVTQTVRVPGKEVQIETVSSTQGENALELLRRTHTITTKRYSFGDVVESIDGVSGGRDGRYWILYVNGKQASVGAGAYTVEQGDSIMWNFQKEDESL